MTRTNTADTEAPPRGEMSLQRDDDGSLRVRLSGGWRIGNDLPDTAEVQRQLAADPGIRRVTFTSQGVTDWDSGLVTFAIKLRELCSRQDIAVDWKGLPAGAQRLIALAAAVPERPGARRATVKKTFLTMVGAAALDFGRSSGEMLGFIGEASLAAWNLLRGRARYRRSDLLQVIQECSAEALPIVSLISLLVGLILAFVGAVQLLMFGAQIYVASLVGIAMVRVMGAVMTGIIMAGRTGAAFAAQLGTMQVNEEIDALRTLGISPMEFLVLPRMLALMLTMPLLCVYADLMGILGGLIVGVGMLDLGVTEYLNMTRASVELSFFWIGLFHAAVFGVLVALAGCLRGMQCGRSAAAVGDATTSAVVTGIVSIILSTAVITIACNVLGI